MVKRIYR